MKVSRSEKHPYLAGQNSPRLFAHRGIVSEVAAQQGTLENTSAAFEAALMAGATAIESDCHLTKDGEVVLIHDADLQRLTGDTDRVNDLTLNDLRTRFQDRGELLTLNEAFEAFPQVRWNIDVKDPLAAASAGRIVAPHWRRTLLTSFDDRIRTKAVDYATSIEQGTVCKPATSPGKRGVVRAVASLFSPSRRTQQRALSEFDALQIPERQGAVRVFSPRLVRLAHTHGIEVHVWTVNDPATMRKLIAAGADGIVTDRVDVAAQMFHPTNSCSQVRDSS